MKITFTASEFAARRGTLLPKLISGELRVKDAERIVERNGTCTDKDGRTGKNVEIR